MHQNLNTHPGSIKVNPAQDRDKWQAVDCTVTSFRIYRMQGQVASC